MLVIGRLGVRKMMKVIMIIKTPKQVYSDEHNYKIICSKSTQEKT